MSSNFPYMPPRMNSPMRVSDEEFARDPFYYTAEFLPLAASASATFRIQIQADSDYLLAMLTGTVKNNDTDEVVIADPAITVEIVSSASGRILMDRAVNWSVIVGTAQRPYILTAPKTFSGNSQISINVVNLIAAAKRVRLTLHGYKLFSGLS